MKHYFFKVFLGICIKAHFKTDKLAQRDVDFNVKILHELEKRSLSYTFLRDFKGEVQQIFIPLFF